jgi:soluble lytic murein transglycosylase
MKKKTKVNIFVIIGLILVLAATGFYLLPGMLADSVVPLKYENWIVQYSKAYGVDPSLVAAVIMQESRFNPSARSGKGASGLMQFMPGTASTMAKETGMTSYDIFDPETSINFGAAHIRDLLVKYNGNVDAALAGYNAGTGNADKWVSLGILGDIPFKETRNYVYNVKKYQQIYATMYAQQLGLLDDPKYSVKVDQKQADVSSSFWTMFFKNLFGKVGEAASSQSS